MSDDLRERLRRGEPCREGCGAPCRTMDAASGCICAEAADRIEQLEAALRPLACTCKTKHPEGCSSGEVDCPFWNARAALEERT